MIRRPVTVIQNAEMTSASSAQTTVGDALGKHYYGKGFGNDKLTKPIWLANEITYYAAARATGLAIPEAIIGELEKNGDVHLLFCSEFKSGRIARSKLDSDVLLDNAKGVVQAIALDVALLNSDRAPWNILLDDRDNKLWYIDHEKALWANGEEDFSGRIAPECLTENTIWQKIWDYSGRLFPQGRQLVFGSDNWDEFKDNLNALRPRELLLMGRQELPEAEWLDDKRFNWMADFLDNWHVAVLHCLDSSSSQRFLAEMTKRDPN